MEMVSSKAVAGGVAAVDDLEAVGGMDGGGPSESRGSDAGGSWVAGGGMAEYELAGVADVKA